jgi:hypothetical protein
MKRGGNIVLKKAFFLTKHPNWGNIQQNFVDNFAKFSEIQFGLL